MSDDHDVKLMNDLVTFEHEGFPCAMSAHAVASADSVASFGQVLRLWHPNEHVSTVDRYLRIALASGPVILPCSRVRTGQSGTARRLSPLLSSVLKSCAVTAIAEIDGKSYWLVDLGASDG